MDLDLLPSIDSDAEIDVAPSDDDDIVAATGKAVGIFEDLVEDRKQSGRRKAAAANNQDGETKQSWSFKQAIAKIDATAPTMQTKLTSLQEKIASVMKGRDNHEDQHVSGKKRKHPVPADEASDDTAPDDDGEDDGEEVSDEADTDTDENEDEDDDDNDEEEEQNDDDSDGEEADSEDGASDDGSEVDNGEPGVHAGRDTVDEILASAKPNPFKQKSTPSSAMDALHGEYAGIFAPDPFAAAKADTIKSKAVSKASAKRSRAEMEAAAGSGDFADVTVTGLADGTALKEPKTFAEMNLSRPLLRAVADLGYTDPTPIQRRCVPLALAGHDICGSAVTGSGKTAAYLLPILERLLYKPAKVAAIRVLILTPTRELATQVHSMCTQLAQHMNNLRVCLIVGGLALKPQEAELRSRPDIVIATPGRVLDHIRNTLAVHCEDVDVLVLDEADRLLEMGFEAEVSEIVKACPVGRQTMLFSATMTAKVDTLAKLSLRKPVRVVADPLYDMAHRLSQEFIRIKPGKENDREAILMSLVTRSFTGGGVLVFAVHKQTAHRLAILFGLAGLKAAELHGNLTQRQRLAALEDFRENRVDFLIATDLAGRGLDIAGVRVVINFEMPKELTAYVHRVGRTARAGRSGVAVTLVSENQRSMMKEIVRRATLNVKSRVVDPASITAWKDKLYSWRDDIRRVIEAEREERAMRLAEVEANKAENFLEHHDEIMARPARTWFMSEREKKELRTAAAAGGDAPSKSKDEDAEKDSKDNKKKLPHRLTRKKRRRMEALAEEEKEEKKVKRAEAQLAREKAAALRSGKSDGDDGDDGPARSKLDPEIAKAKRDVELTAAAKSRGSAKSAKALLRKKALQLGVTPGIAKRIVDREVKGLKKKRSSAGAAGKPMRGKSSFDTEISSKSKPATGFKPEKMHKPGKKAGSKSFKKFKRR